MMVIREGLGIGKLEFEEVTKSTLDGDGVIRALED